MSLDAALAQRLLDRLRAATSDGVGISRESYGAGESAALDIVEAEARAHGLAVDRDAGANLVVTLPGRDPALPFLACGSHLDSVPQGGNYDGAAGVVAGLLALVRFGADGFSPLRTIKLYALRGEESAWFGRAYIGSSALMGKLSADDLAMPHVVTGRLLIDRMRDAGVAVDRVARGEKLLDPATVAAWLELHIEQGPVLVARNLPLAVVTGIRGNVRHRSIECLGEAGHSGTIPRWLRHDAVFATAELIIRLDRHWRTLLERGRDLVVTSGIIGTDPAEHALARIPGRLRFSFEARSQSTETLEAFYDLFRSECAGIEEERGVTFRFDRRLDSAPARMDEAWTARLRATLREMGLPDEPIPSGAGHDAAVFANAGVPSAMIFVRNEHGSHNPMEAMAMDDFLRGAELLWRTLRTAAGQDAAGPDAAGHRADGHGAASGRAAAGPDEAGPDEAGPDEAGPDEAGPDEAGPDEAGPVEAGPVEAGPDEAGPDEAGPDEAGPVEAGPVEAGPDEAGPDEAGLDAAARGTAGSP